MTNTHKTSKHLQKLLLQPHTAGTLKPAKSLGRS